MSSAKKRHKIKEEKKDRFSSSNGSKDRDLSAYTDDRVEMLQQVFSAMKPKDIIAIAPKHIKHLPLKSIQELCLEELLGISSKRLCSILDGFEPPSDTESSSSSPNISDVLSLDSISSDEGALSPKQNSEKSRKKVKSVSKKSKKCKRKQKPKDKSSKGKASENSAERAGLTVLELLELQARARAIRAQLQMEQRRAVVKSVSKPISSGSDDDIQIKEEPAQIVELISSDDEKPNIEDLNKKIEAEQPKKISSTPTKENKDMQTATKPNDVTIVVPKATRKIKLNRHKSSAPPTQSTSDISSGTVNTGSVVTKNVEVSNPTKSEKEHVKAPIEQENKLKLIKKKTKTKKKRRKPLEDYEDSEHDGLILQLSESEKLDLEDFDSKNANAKTESEDSSSDKSDVSSADSKAVSKSQITVKNEETEIIIDTSKTEENIIKIEENTVSQSDDLLNALHPTESLKGPVVKIITSHEGPTETFTADTNCVTESTTGNKVNQEIVKDLCDSSTKIESPTSKPTDYKHISEDEDILSLTGNDEILKQNYSDSSVAEVEKKSSEHKKKKKEKKAKNDKNN